jgi:hypothetical protein
VPARNELATTCSAAERASTAPEPNANEALNNPPGLSSGLRRTPCNTARLALQEQHTTARCILPASVALHIPDAQPCVDVTHRHSRGQLKCINVHDHVQLHAAQQGDTVQRQQRRYTAS